jgi:hypothetical protein
VIQAHKWIWKSALLTMLMVIIPMVIDLVNMAVTSGRVDYMIRFATNRGIQYTSQETFRGGGMTSDIGGKGFHIDLVDYPEWEQLFGTNSPAQLMGQIYGKGNPPADFLSGLGTVDYDETKSAARWDWAFGVGAPARHKAQLKRLDDDIQIIASKGDSGEYTIHDSLVRWRKGAGGDEFYGTQMLTPNNLGIAYVPIEAAQTAAQWHLATLLTSGDLDSLFTRDGRVYVIWYGWEVEITSLALQEYDTRMINTGTQAGRDEFMYLLGGSLSEDLLSNGSGWTRVIFFDFQINMRYVGISGFRLFARAVTKTLPETDFIAINAGDEHPSIQRWLNQIQGDARTAQYRHGVQSGMVGVGMDADPSQVGWHFEDKQGESIAGVLGTRATGRTWFGVGRVGSGRLMYHHVH